MRSFGKLMKPASSWSDDAGFTLIEVVIAIVLIGGAMLSVLAATTSGVVFQGMARQRQTAVSLANQTMEQLRSMPKAAIIKGINSFPIAKLTGGGGGSWPTNDPDIWACGPGGAVLRLFDCTSDVNNPGTGELIVSHSCSSGCLESYEPLVYKNNTGATQWNNAGSRVIDGVTYTWRAYVSLPSSGEQNLYRLTVAVFWTSRGQASEVRLQSLAAFPAGCVSTETHYVSGPCYGGVSSGGGGGLMTIKVTYGTEQTVWTLPLGSLEARLVQEQTTDIVGSVTLLGRKQTSILRDEDSLSLQPGITVPDPDCSTNTTSSACTKFGVDWVYGASGGNAFSHWLIESSVPDTSIYPRVEAFFDTAVANSRGPEALLKAAITDTTDRYCGVPDTGSGHPCIAIQENASPTAGQDYAITVGYRTSSTQLFPLLRISKGSLAYLWQHKFEMFRTPGTLPAAQSTDIWGSRLIGEIAFGGTCRDFNASCPSTSFVGTLSSVCDRLKARIAPAGETNPDTPVCSGTSAVAGAGARHSDTFDYWYAADPTTGNNPSALCTAPVDKGPVYSQNLSNLEAWRCDTNVSTTGYYTRVSSLTWKYPTRTSDGVLSYWYEVKSCTVPATGSNPCGKRNGFTVPVVSPVFVEITLPSLKVNPSNYDYW